MRVDAHSGVGVRWWHRATLLALFALFLLPIHYRAGAAMPHGHALLQLIFESRSGVPVHHHRIDRDAGDHGSDVANAQRGSPPIQVSATSALLPPILLAFALQALLSAIRMCSDPRLTGRSIRPEHPPPKWV